MAGISFLHPDMVTFTIRMIVAAFLAGFVGLEREFKQHPAGLRTHLLVGVGSCLMMTMSIYGLEKYVGMHENVRFDPARIPSYVISGIGFLGAGTIIVHGRRVRGLTTAASIWVVAGIGLVVGAGMYFEAILATVIVVLSLFLLTKIEPLYVKKESRRMLTVFGGEHSTLEDIVKILESCHILVEKKAVDKFRKDDSIQKKYTLHCMYSRNEKMVRAIDSIARLEHVTKVSNGLD